MKVEHSYTKNENGLKQPTEDTGQWTTQSVRTKKKKKHIHIHIDRVLETKVGLFN
jgi:hypothetical protein